MYLRIIVTLLIVLLPIVGCSGPNQTPTFASAFPHTAIPTLMPVYTLDPSAFVELLSVEYVGGGEGCTANIHLQVSGAPVTGYFRVWNAWFSENGMSYDSGYTLVTLPVGFNTYLVGLGGNSNPAYYIHEVWFEYNGTSSNRLTNLICPGLTPSP